MPRHTILVVDDEEDILQLLDFNLRQAGFDVLTASDGEEALEVANRELPDLIVLDLMLPGIDGNDVCRQLRQQPETRTIPIIMLTAKGEEIDRVVGFELGADDYVTKPFSPRELILRIKAILRRIADQSPSAEILEVGRVRIDTSRYLVTVDGKPTELTSTEFKLLLTLAERRGRVQTRDELLETVWGYAYPGFTRTVDTHIRRLRSKLGPASEMIETVRGVGYRFREDE
jgi:two-component system phosphate regulon response regulator PhoB